MKGSHIWEIDIEHSDTSTMLFPKPRKTSTLMISTQREEPKMATQKAETFLRNHPGRYPAAKIQSVRYSGEIDA